MRQYTFWPDRKWSQQAAAPLLVAGAALLATGLVWGGIALFESIPDRAALRPVHGQVESVTNVGRMGRRPLIYRYDFDVTTVEGPRRTYWLDQDWLSAPEASALERKTASFLVTGGDAWIMAINAGGADILTYDKARRLWEDDKNSRLKIGLAVGLFGLVLAGIHVWKVRRSAPSGTA